MILFIIIFTLYVILYYYIVLYNINRYYDNDNDIILIFF